jgi:hypothetical protein
MLEHKHETGSSDAVSLCLIALNVLTHLATQLITKPRPSGQYLAISVAIMNVARTIRKAQAQLASHKGTLPIEITQIEHEAFRTCIQLMEEAAAFQLRADEIFEEFTGFHGKARDTARSLASNRFRDRFCV